MFETIWPNGASKKRMPVLKESPMCQREATLLRQVAAGDESAFRRLVEAHKDMVYNLALRILGDPHEAEDVLQDVFLSAFKGLSGFRGEAKFSTWLYSITTNRCRRTLSSRRRAGLSSRLTIRVLPTVRILWPPGRSARPFALSRASSESP